jgi:hypothetical protein
MRIRAAWWTLFLAGFAGAMAAAPVRKPTPSPSPAVSASPAATPSPVAVMSPSCAAPQHRQFDFWLGEWDLVGSDGKKSATDKVVQVLGGCALQENGNSVEGVQRMSVSAYDPATRHWHQTLMDDGGAVLHLEGEFADGKMILVGQRPSQKEKGATITHRIIWTPMHDHRVRKLWEFSNNGGRTWRPFFEGTYTPRR